jgi:CRISPR/Cas system-associated exonuclease Cas4 (RecB family)
MIPILEPVLSPQSKNNGSPDRVAELQKTISASRLSLWLQCRLKFYFRYLAQIQRPPTPSMHAGSTVHAVLQSWNMARWCREPFAVERFKALFGSQWIKLQESAHINWREKESFQRDSAWAALELYLNQTPINVNEKPEAVEVSVEADLSRNGLPTLVGIIDLVRMGGRIVDFKLVSKSPSAAHAIHMHELQLTCYSLLYRDATGTKESALELHHLVRTKEPKLIVSSMPPATEQQKARLFRQIESYQAGLARQDFVPSPGFHCAGCEYFNECQKWNAKESNE